MTTAETITIAHALVAHKGYFDTEIACKEGELWRMVYGYAALSGRSLLDPAQFGELTPGQLSADNH